MTMSTATTAPVFMAATRTYRGRRPRNFTNVVGYMAVHPQKGVYLGADTAGTPVYAVRRKIISTRDQLIPLLSDDVSLLALVGLDLADKRAMHLFQVAALEGVERDGYRYTDVRRAFHFSSGDIKTAICEKPDETTHIEPPVGFSNPRHFDIACRLAEAANRLLPFGKQPVHVPL
ncbi:MAG: hypothetical protein EBQ96_09830 [Proteobacteria bacterium]|nr:hypothetical protein [Pseudomonadota bacterium]